MNVRRLAGDQAGGAFCSVHVPGAGLRRRLLLYFTAQNAPPTWSAIRTSRRVHCRSKSWS